MIDKAHMANIQSMLDQIRQYEVKAKGISEPSGSEPGVQKTGFSDLLKGAFQSVNSLEQKAQSMTDDYQMGRDVSLTDTVMAVQKSSIAFEATLQIRNKVIKAYDEIKNMPI